MFSGTIFSPCLLFSYSRSEHENANRPYSGGNVERNHRGNLPEKPANERRRRDRNASTQIVQPDHPRPKSRFGKIDDERLTRGLAHLAETTHYERCEQPGKAG